MNVQKAMLETLIRVSEKTLERGRDTTVDKGLDVVAELAAEDFGVDKKEFAQVVAQQARQVIDAGPSVVASTLAIAMLCGLNLSSTEEEKKVD